MLPNMFQQDFGDQINRYVTLKSIGYFTSIFFFKYHNSFHINNYQEKQLILQLFSEYLAA